jgi:hypothetical protein
MTIIEKIKLLFAAKTPITELVNEAKQIKSGYKTVSFWVTVVASISSLVAALTGFIPVTAALIASTAITVVYNVLRAIQNAGVDGTVPLFQSSRFWVGILGIVLAGLTQLQTGGIDPKWVQASIAIIGAVMAGAQSLGAQQPAEETPK